MPTFGKSIRVAVPTGTVSTTIRPVGVTLGYMAKPAWLTLEEAKRLQDHLRRAIDHYENISRA